MIIAIISSTPRILAQTPQQLSARPAGRDSVLVAAGPQFKASRSKQFWWGTHWRKEWIKPQTFPIFDFDSTAGGLTAVKEGGGHETKTLRLRGGDGKEYVLRTIDKSLDVLIPAIYKGTYICDVVNDQISTAHPYGPSVIADLTGYARLLHTNPKFYFVKPDPRLGEFEADFAGKLCLFEERPSGKGWENTPLTNHGDEIINSEDLLKKLQEKNDERIDQREFLKARLFDMIINDWDRHEDQWVWVAHKVDSGKVFQPFARDRDQSFSKTDGVNLFFISLPWAVRSVQNMSPNLRDVIGSNLSALSLDRQLLNQLDRRDWLSIIDTLQSELTDAEIAESLKRLPPGIDSLSGDFLSRRLKQRRDNMDNYGKRYYRKLSKEVTVVGSDKKERFTINRIDNRTTQVTVQRLSTKEAYLDTIYNRVFNRRYTHLVHLYGLDGDDEFIYKGRAANRIRLRSFGNDGDDRYTDSLNDGHDARRSRIYDTPKDKTEETGSMRYRSTKDTSVTNFHRRAFKYDYWMPNILPSYNPDDHFLITGSFTYRKQRFNKHPFGWEQRLGATYAPSTGAYGLFYQGLFKKAVGQWDLTMNASYQAPTYVINFYGFGNGTELHPKEKSYYRIRASSVQFAPGVTRTWNKSILAGSILFNTFEVQRTADKFANTVEAGLDDSIHDTRYFGGLGASYVYDNTDNDKSPTRGVKLQTSARYLMNLEQHDRDFVNLQGAFSFFVPLGDKLVFAHRTGAATNIGQYEFYQANTLGGSMNLRGYWRNRFSGKSSVYQNTELRWKLADFQGYVFRGSFGAYGFFDDGRVWHQQNQSDKIHVGYGAGLFYIPYQAFTLNLSYAISHEVNVVVVRVGFLF